MDEQMTRLARQSVVLLVIGLAAFLLLSLGSLSKAIGPDSPVFSLGTLPYVLLGLVALLGLRIHQLRMAQLALLLAFAYAWLTEPAVASALGASGRAHTAVLALSLPMTGAIILLLRESRLLSAYGLGSTVLLTLPTLGLLRAAKTTSFLDPVLAWEVLPPAVPWSLPDATLPLMAAFALAMYLRRDPVTSSFDLAALIGFGPLFYVLSDGTSASHTSYAVAFSAAGTALAYAVFGVYWQRVYTDELTGIPNRRALNEYLKTLGGRYAIGMVDVDRFKKFNDKYGHDEGDNVLRYVAKTLSREARGRVFRFGGEEFAVVYRRSNAEKASQHLEHARAKLEKRDFWIRAPKTVRSKRSKKDRGKGLFSGTERKKVTITASFGVADRSERKLTPAGVMKRADKALYKAKKKGRNRVIEG